MYADLGIEASAWNYPRGMQACFQGFPIAVYGFYCERLPTGEVAFQPNKGMTTSVALKTAVPNCKSARNISETTRRKWQGRKPTHSGKSQNRVKEERKKLQPGGGQIRSGVDPFAKDQSKRRDFVFAQFLSAAASANKFTRNTSRERVGKIQCLFIHGFQRQRCQTLTRENHGGGDPHEPEKCRVGVTLQEGRPEHFGNTENGRVRRL